MKRTLILISLLPLAACNPATDYNGTDPATYLSTHEKVSQVETLYATYNVSFTGSTLSIDEKERLHAFLNDISATNIDHVTVSFRTRDNDRAKHLLRLLRTEGMPKSAVSFTTDKNIPSSSAKLDVAYSMAVLPNCPDWSKSSTHNYSNTMQSNMGCATAVNLGLMVADPKDLESGSGDITPNPDRTAMVLEKYRTDLNFGSTSSSSNSSSGSSSTSSATSQ